MNPEVTITVGVVQGGEAIVSFTNEVEVRAFQFNFMESESGLAPEGDLVVEVEDILDGWIVSANSVGGVATLIANTFGDDQEVPVSDVPVPLLTIQVSSLLQNASRQ